MFASRFSVLRTVNRIGNAEKKKITKAQIEVDSLKRKDLKYFQDRDIYENSKNKLRFRKLPWGQWIMGCLFVFGTFYVIYEIYEELRGFKPSHLVREYLMLCFTLITGFLFLYTGKIKHTIFDKNQGTLTIKKRNTFCNKRSIVTYHLSDISEIRAVYRGQYTGNGTS